MAPASRIGVRRLPTVVHRFPMSDRSAIEGWVTVRVKSVGYTQTPCGAHLVECTSQLVIDDIDGHLLRLDKIKRLLPKYRDVRLMGVVAAMVMSHEVALTLIAKACMCKGLYVPAQSGDTVLIRNDAQFSPKVW